MASTLTTDDAPVRDTRLWHPFSDMAAVRGAEFVISRAEGVWVWDDDDRRYLDATASLWYANVGHGRREIADAVRDQLVKLDAYSVFGDYTNEPARELAERLAAHAPMPDPRVFLTTGGGDSVDTAAKLARHYWSALGRPGKVHLLSRIGGYHGTHGFGTAIGGIEVNRHGYGPLLQHASLVEHDAVDGLEREIARIGADAIAAFFVEPVIGAGGVHPPPPGYMEGVAEVCERHDILLVADAVICGFGRLGTWFGVERWGIEPDMITFAKGVTSGYQPLGGVMVSGRVADPFWSEAGRVIRHGATYAGHPAACAAALVNLDILEREGLMTRGAELEQDLLGVLAPLTRHPLVSEVRGGTGLMAAVEIDADALAGGVSVPAVAAATRAHGILVRPLASSIAFSPPLTIATEELALIGSSVLEALDSTLARA
jgi:adenosylmethionine-8-amino-7-oxononanoate aminotransferase